MPTKKKPRALKLTLKQQTRPERLKIYNALHWYWQQSPGYGSSTHRKTMRGLVNLAAAAANRPLLNEDY